MGNDFDLIAVLLIAFSTFELISLVLYGRYWTRDYPGDPERPPHYILCTLGLILSLSIYLSGLIGTLSANASDFQFSGVIGVFLRVWIGGVFALGYDVVRRRLRQRRQVQRQR